MPAEFLQDEAVPQLGTDIEQRDALGREQPLVRVGHHEIGLDRPGVEGQGPQMLNRVHAEQDAPAVQGRAEAVEIHAQPGGELHRTAGEEGGLVVAGGEQRILRSVEGQRHLAHLQSETLRRHQPDHAVGGELATRNHDVLAGGPGQAEGDDG
jgi:hypothetical protein